MPAGVRAEAQAGALEAIRRLRLVVRDNSSPAAAAVLAARELLDRGYGRAVPEEVLSVPDRAPASPVTEEELRERLERVFEAQSIELTPSPGGARRFRLPDGRELGVVRLGRRARGLG